MNITRQDAIPINDSPETAFAVNLDLIHQYVRISYTKDIHPIQF